MTIDANLIKGFEYGIGLGIILGAVAGMALSWLGFRVFR